MIYILLCILSFLLELYALGAGEITHFAQWNIYRYFLLHTIASALLSWCQVKWLESRYPDERLKVFLFFFVFMVVTLSFGLLLSLLIVIFGLLHVKVIEKTQTLDKISFNAISDDFPEIKRIFGEASLAHTLNQSDARMQTKIKVLSALSEINTPEAITLIKQALSDESDEVRLYSFSLIDHFEKELNKKIHIALDALHQSKEISHKVQRYKTLALLYWDMLYYELADDNLKHYFLTKIQSIMSESLLLAPHDEDLIMLQGRLYLFNGDINNAELLLHDTLEYSGTYTKAICSYLAEIAFLKQEYWKIPSLIALYPSASLDLKMYGMQQVWNHKK
ncbi:MAG TPA: hypothetical protein PLM93_02890 [Sulfuricurvum sp.]|nr:hypothetical protein [Sulfuricurvum sp.]HQT36557.1 hypothetical protein [Sulfuricurvum sp.]